MTESENRSKYETLCSQLEKCRLAIRKIRSAIPLELPLEHPQLQAELAKIDKLRRQENRLRRELAKLDTLAAE